MYLFNRVVVASRPFLRIADDAYRCPGRTRSPASGNRTSTLVKSGTTIYTGSLAGCRSPLGTTPAVTRQRIVMPTRGTCYPPDVAMSRRSNHTSLSAHGTRLSATARPIRPHSTMLLSSVVQRRAAATCPLEAKTTFQTAYTRLRLQKSLTP